MFGNLCYAPRCSHYRWTSWHKWQKPVWGTAVSVPPLWAKLALPRLTSFSVGSHLFHRYWFSAGSAPHRERDHYCRVQWTCEDAHSSYPGRRGKALCSDTTPASARMSTAPSHAHRDTGTFCPAPGLSLIPEWLSDKSLVGAPVASRCALSKSHFVFNIFITTYWQDAVCTHFSCVYIHITHTRACSNKYLWVPSNHLSAASFSPFWTVHQVQEH